MPDGHFTSAPAGGGAQPNPLAGVTFDLDGVTFRCEGRTSLLELSELARRVADSPGDVTATQASEDPAVAAAAAAAMAGLATTLLQALGPSEYARFRAHCRARQTPDETVVLVMQYINDQVQGAVEEDTGRPTTPPSPSPDGPSDPAGRIARVVSFSTGDVTVLDPAGQVISRGNARDRQDAPVQVKTLGQPQRPPGPPRKGSGGGRKRTA